MHADDKKVMVNLAITIGSLILLMVLIIMVVNSVY